MAFYTALFCHRCYRTSPFCKESYEEQCFLLRERNLKRSCVSLHDTFFFHCVPFLYYRCSTWYCYRWMYIRIERQLCFILSCFSCHEDYTERWTCTPNVTPQRIFPNFFSVSAGTESTQFYQFSIGTYAKMHIYWGKPCNVTICA